jgi:hypothetical protein
MVRASVLLNSGYGDSVVDLVTQSQELVYD